MTRAAFALLFGYLSSSATAAAETTASASLSLSLGEAARLAEEHNPLVRRALRERGVTVAARAIATPLLPANPVVTVTAGARRDRSGSAPPSAGPEVTGRLEQMFELAGQRGTRIAEAERAIDVAGARVDLVRLESRARVRAAYVTTLLARRSLEQAREQEALGERVYESARARAAAGAGTDVDLNLAEVERGRIAQERVRAELAVADGVDRLRLAVGIPERTALVLTTALAAPDPIELSLDALLARARLRRAELKVLEAGSAQLDASIVRLRRERVPNPTLFFDVMSQQPGQLYLGAGIALPLPVWRHGRGELAVAHAGRELLEEERAIFEQQLEIEIAAAYRQTRALREAVTRGTDVVVPAAERNVELVTQGWRSGKFDLFRVVQTAREAADARRRQLELLGALWDATITLERISGGAS